MNTTTGATQLPQLVKQSATYKLIVPEKVEEKIRYLCRKFPNLEWSGVLFYTHTGGFDNNSLVITCEDIYPMDLGTSTYTDFTMSGDVAGYMAENVELFDCDLSLIHSHNSFSAFFSGTDLNTLREEGNERNCFVSLIVNNAGEYCAAVTRKLQTKSEVTVKRLGQSYEFFGEGEISLEGNIAETTQVIEKEVIEYFMLDVERHEVTNPLGYLDERFAEIIKKKEEAKPKVETAATSYIGRPWDRDPWNTYANEEPWYMKTSVKETKPKEKEPCLFDEKTMKEMEVDTVWTPDSKLVHEAAVRMVTCNLILNVEKFDFKQWVTRHMDNVYKRIFFQPQAWDSWRDFIIEFYTENFNDPSTPDSAYENIDWYVSTVAEALLDELLPYREYNEWMMDYCSQLEMLLV